MKLIISILLFSTVTYASGANHKYYFVNADSAEKRSVSSINSVEIKPTDLVGDYDKIERTLCMDKALEKFINYSKLNPGFLVNLATLKIEDIKKSRGVKNASYSVDFLVSNNIIPMRVSASYVEGACF